MVEWFHFYLNAIENLVYRCIANYDFESYVVMLYFLHIVDKYYFVSTRNFIKIFFKNS